MWGIQWLDEVVELNHRIGLMIPPWVFVATEAVGTSAHVGMERASQQPNGLVLDCGSNQQIRKDCEKPRNIWGGIAQVVIVPENPMAQHQKHVDQIGEIGEEGDISRA